MSLNAKARVSADEMNVFKNETFLEISPKTVAISQIKMLDKNGKEIALEQTLIQSGFNLKIEEILENIKPLKINLTTILPDLLWLCYEEMECLGFNLTELILNTKKGYFEVMLKHIEFDKPTYHNCSSFWLPCEDGIIYTNDRIYKCKHVKWKLQHAPILARELGRVTPKEYEETQYASFMFFTYYEFVTKALSEAVKAGVFGKYNPEDDKLIEEK